MNKQYPYTGPQGESQPPDGVAVKVGQGGPQGNMTGPPSQVEVVKDADRRDGLPWLTGSNVGDFPPYVPRQSQPDPDGITAPGSTPRVDANPTDPPANLLRPEGNGDGPPAPRPSQAAASFESKGEPGYRDKPTPPQALASFNAIYDEDGTFSWDESKVNRDEQGKFAEGEGGGKSEGTSGKVSGHVTTPKGDKIQKVEMKPKRQRLNDSGKGEGGGATPSEGSGTWKESAEAKVVRDKKLAAAGFTKRPDGNYERQHGKVKTAYTPEQAERIADMKAQGKKSFPTAAQAKKDEETGRGEIKRLEGALGAVEQRQRMVEEAQTLLNKGDLKGAQEILGKLKRERYG